MPQMTVPQLAEAMGLSRVAVHRRVKKGQIRAKRIGHSYIISSEEVSRVLRTRLSAADRAKIDKAVRHVVAEYGQLLKRLSRE